MPEVDSAFQYLVAFFYSAGMANSTGMGLVSLSWQEIRAWRLERDLDLTFWEKETIKKMSDAYCSEYFRASDPKRPMPYQRNLEQIDPEIELQKALSWRSIIRARGK